MGRSAAAILAGILVNVILALVIDEALHLAGVYPPWGQPMFAPGLNALALSYRVIIAVLGGYITAKGAPAHPIRHALMLGALGLIVSGAGAVSVAPMDLGPAWYPWSLVVIALPCSWLGGVLHQRLQRDSSARPAVR